MWDSVPLGHPVLSWWYLDKRFYYLNILDLTDGLPNNPHLKCTICSQRLEDTHFVQVPPKWALNPVVMENVFV